MNTVRHSAPGLSARQRGVSIVEALVALVILSVGMLGIAGLYLESVRTNRTALARTTAIQLVNDMADRIRANRAALDSYALALGVDPGTPTDCAGATVHCTPQQAARFDLANWRTAAIAALPKGPNNAAANDAQVGVEYTDATPTVPRRYVITVNWLEPGSADRLSTQLEVQL